MEEEINEKVKDCSRLARFHPELDELVETYVPYTYSYDLDYQGDDGGDIDIFVEESDTTGHIEVFRSEEGRNENFNFDFDNPFRIRSKIESIKYDDLFFKKPSSYLKENFTWYFNNVFKELFHDLINNKWKSYDY